MMRRYVLLTLAVQGFNLLLTACCGCGAFFILVTWWGWYHWLGIVAGLIMAFVGRVAASCTVLDFANDVLTTPEPTDELAHATAPEAR